MRCKACCASLNKLAAKLGAVVLAAAGCVAPPAGAGTVVYAAGDIARCVHPDARWSGAAGTAALVADRLAHEADALVLVLGDNVYPRGALADYQACYGPTWGRFRERTLPAPGNREYATPGAAGYFAYFGAAAGRGYYSRRAGSWLLVSLDSNLQGAAQAAQLAWLKQELERQDAPCTLAWWHHPLYSSGGHGSDPRMREAWRLLHAAGAELVLSGHDHDYERFAPQDADGRLDEARGLRQFVVGTGGAFATWFGWPKANSAWRDANRSGVLRLALGEAGYAWEFLEASYDGFPNGQAPDRGQGQCH